MASSALGLDDSTLSIPDTGSALGTGPVSPFDPTVDPSTYTGTIDYSGSGGIDPLTGDVVASAPNPVSTPNTAATNSIWSDVLKLGSIGASVTNAFTARTTPTTTLASQRTLATPAKVGTATSSPYLFLFIALFVGLVIWLEVEH